MRNDIIDLGLVLWLRACGSIIGLVGGYVWEASLKEPCELNCEVWFCFCLLVLFCNCFCWFFFCFLGGFCLGVVAVVVVLGWGGWGELMECWYWLYN